MHKWHFQGGISASLLYPPHPEKVTAARYFPSHCNLQAALRVVQVVVKAFSMTREHRQGEGAGFHPLLLTAGAWDAGKGPSVFPETNDK